MLEIGGENFTLHIQFNLQKLALMCHKAYPATHPSPLFLGL